MKKDIRVQLKIKMKDIIDFEKYEMVGFGSTFDNQDTAKEAEITFFLQLKNTEEIK